MAKNQVLQTVVEIAGSVDPSLGSSVQGALKHLNKINLKSVAIAGAAVAGTAAIVKGVVKACKALTELGNEFDSAYDAIRIGTGATGEALDALKDDFKAVYSSVPTTMEDAATAVADYNTRLGLTGEELQNLSKQAIQVADLLGDDLSGVVESSSKAFQQWKITAEDMGGAMDYVFKVSQATGVGFTELMDSAQQYGAQLQEMGYSFEEATALIGQLEKSGVNTSEVLSAMKKSVAALADEGIGAAEGLQLYIDAIKNAKDSTNATALAAEIFGTRAASTMAAAIRDGTLSIEDFTAAIEQNSETIAGCAEDTYDYQEKLQLFKQQAQVALEPLAMTMFDSLNELMPVIGDLMNSLIPIIKDMTATLTPLIKNLVAKLGPMLQKLVPPVLRIASSLLGKVLPPLMKVIDAVLPVMIQLIELLAPVLEFVAEAILPVLAEVIAALLPPLMKVIESVLPIVIELLNQIIPVLVNLIESVLPVIIQLIEALTPVIEEIVQNVLPVVIKLLNAILPIVLEIINKVLPVIVKLLQSLLPIVTKIIEGVLPVIVTLLDAITPLLDLVIALLEPILDLVMKLVTPILDLISTALGPLIDIITTLINIALEPLKPLIEAVAGLFSGTLGAALNAIMPIVEMITSVFGGLIDFISNVFAGNWSAAWDSIAGIFTGIWNGVVGFFKGIINGIITIVETGINAIIKVINGITSAISSVWTWTGIPGIPAIPLVSLPRLATGGFTDGISIAGEEGTEAVISFDPRYRDRNIETWHEAGKLLGVLDNIDLDASARAATTAAIQNFNVEQTQASPILEQAGKLMSMDDFTLGSLTETTIVYYDFSGMNYAPQIEGGEVKDEGLMEKLRAHAFEFFDWLEEWLDRRQEGRYDAVRIY